jgi:hypothetical protein
MNTIDKEREELEILLLWHAAGTLDRRNAERVEEALADDRELSRRFELARDERDETIYLNESWADPLRGRKRSCLP